MAQDSNLLEYREIDRKNNIFLYEVHLENIRQGYRAREYISENNFREVCVNGYSWNKVFRKLKQLRAMEKSIDEHRGYMIEKKPRKKRRYRGN